MPRGTFISFEGGEGSGKSTQIALLETRLRAQGHTVCRTREPGGSPGAEEIRALLVSGSAGRWSPVTEALLMYASRSDHLERTIRPALQAGQVVLCDRFFDSSLAYQGGPGGVGRAFLDHLNAGVVGATRPDLTLIFDIPVEIGLARAGARGGANRFESKGAAYHQAIRAAYQALAAAEPARCVLIDANRPPEVIAADIAARVERVLGAP